MFALDYSTISGTQVKSGYFNLYGSAVSTTIAADGGYMCVSSGGSANSTVVECSLLVYNGSGISHTTVKNNGVVLLYGPSVDTTISSGGKVDLYYGYASATTICDGGWMLVSGGIALDVTMSGGSLHVSSSVVSGLSMYGGTVQNDSLVSSGLIAGGTLEVGQFASAAALDVSCGEASMAEHGYFNGTITGSGVVRFGSAAELYDVMVSSGGKFTGSINLNSEFVSISFLAGSILDFNISRLAPENDALVTNYSFLDGMPEFTLTVTDSQGNGTYNLATGVESFGWNISVMNTSDILLGLLMIGRTVTIGGTDYTLNMGDDGLLSVTVGPYTPPGPEPPPPTADWIFFNGDYNGDGFDMLAVETPEQAGAQPASVAIYQNGEPWGLGVALDYGWEVVGSGDFNGDGLDDFLRVNGEGYVVGEMSNGNGTFSAQVLNLKSPGWDILGVGDFNGNGTDDVLIANPTGASETVGLLGYWESGATWTLINGYSPEWECVATGDFNADGTDDIAWANTDTGLVGYWQIENKELASWANIATLS